MDHDVWQSPFSWRYGSAEMRALWSETARRRLWRRIWVALAETQADAGLVTAAQVADVRAHQDDVDLPAALAREARLHHDMMAELETFAAQCPVGGGILHLGATSMDVQDNADALRLREALALVLGRLQRVLTGFARKINELADVPTLGFTHLQAAEPTTMGYRLAQYGQDLAADWVALQALAPGLLGKGFKGAVGTAASYAQLLEGTGWSIARFEAGVMARLGLPAAPVATQTAPRKQEYTLLAALAGLGQSVYRFAADLRLLHDCLAGPDRRDPASRTYPRVPASAGLLRILHVPTLADQPCDRAILDASDRAAGTMRRLGHLVQTAEMPVDLAALNAVWPRIARIGLARMFDAAPQLAVRASPSYLEMAAEGHNLPAVQLWEIFDIVQDLRRDVARIFADWDVVMMPCAAARPWAAATPYPDKIDGRSVGPRGHAIYTGWVNAAGIPGLAIPVGPPVEGIPVGLQLIADIGQEDLLLELAADYERAAPLQPAGQRG